MKPTFLSGYPSASALKWVEWRITWTKSEPQIETEKHREWVGHRAVL